MKNELKNRLGELAKLEAITKKAEAEYEADYMNAEKEKTYDTAYDVEFAAFMDAADLIVKMTAGKIDKITAREMARTKRNEILSILA